MDHEFDSDIHKDRRFMIERNYYDILGVVPSASQSEIREAYMRQKNTYASDNQATYSLLDQDNLSQTIDIIEKAFSTLNDQRKRRQYNEKIGVENPCESQSYGDDLMEMTMPSEPAVHHEREDVFTIQNRDYMESTTIPPLRKVAKIRSVASSAQTEDAKAAMQVEMENADLSDGQLYKKLRDIVGVSEDEMQENTKISKEFIRNMEENVFDRLPQTVYVKGFLRSYLRYLAAPDYEKLVQAYTDRFQKWQKSKTS